MAKKDKLKSFKASNKKAYQENINEVVDELQFERDMANPRAISGVKSINAIKRAIRQEIPDSTRKWLEANGHGDLWPKYKKWVKGVAKEKNRLASSLANELGLDLEKEHWTPVAGMGDIPPKMPFTSVSDRGPDSEGGIGSGKFNRRVGNKPVFQRKVLQQLGVATNWQESVSNFVADRPDIKDVAERKKLNLQPLPVRKASNLALLKLQQKDLTGGQLESMMDLEYDLKKSGLNWLGLSMNGGLDDEVYKRFDNGKYAKLKTRALEYCIKHKIVPHINIIVDPTNLHIINPLINHTIKLCQKYNRKIGVSFPLTIRIKSVAKMGNFLDTYSFSIDELVRIIKKEFGKFTDEKIIPNFMIDRIQESNTCMVYFETEVGKMGGKVTDWTIDDDGLPLAKSKRRGIITENYEIEPFFEYYGGIDETQSPRLEQ